jgi:hypothetical protein
MATMGGARCAPSAARVIARLLHPSHLASESFASGSRSPSHWQPFLRVIRIRVDSDPNACSAARARASGGLARHALGKRTATRTGKRSATRTLLAASRCSHGRARAPTSYTPRASQRPRGVSVARPAPRPTAQSHGGRWLGLTGCDGVVSRGASAGSHGGRRLGLTGGVGWVLRGASAGSHEGRRCGLTGGDGWVSRGSTVWFHGGRRLGLTGGRQGAGARGRDRQPGGRQGGRHTGVQNRAYRP